MLELMPWYAACVLFATQYLLIAFVTTVCLKHSVEMNDKRMSQSGDLTYLHWRHGNKIMFVLGWTPVMQWVMVIYFLWIVFGMLFRGIFDYVADVAKKIFKP